MKRILCFLAVLFFASGPLAGSGLWSRTRQEETNASTNPSSLNL